MVDVPKIPTGSGLDKLVGSLRDGFVKDVEMFVKYPKYFKVFTSCNRSFKVHKERGKSLWCGECAKCVFVFTLLSMVYIALATADEH